MGLGNLNMNAPCSDFENKTYVLTYVNFDHIEQLTLWLIWLLLCGYNKNFTLSKILQNYCLL